MAASSEVGPPLSDPPVSRHLAAKLLRACRGLQKQRHKPCNHTNQGLPSSDLAGPVTHTREYAGVDFFALRHLSEY